MLLARAPDVQCTGALFGALERDVEAMGFLALRVLRVDYVAPKLCRASRTAVHWTVLASLRVPWASIETMNAAYKNVDPLPLLT